MKRGVIAAVCVLLLSSCDVIEYEIFDGDSSAMIGAVFGIITWLALSFVVASGAKNRGRSYGGFLTLSLLSSPLMGAFILFVLGDRK